MMHTCVQEACDSDMPSLHSRQVAFCGVVCRSLCDVVCSVVSRSLCDWAVDRRPLCPYVMSLCLKRKELYVLCRGEQNVWQRTCLSHASSLQVVKMIWQHVKANDLQDPKDKRVLPFTRFVSCSSSFCAVSALLPDQLLCCVNCCAGQLCCCVATSNENLSSESIFHSHAQTT